MEYPILKLPLEIERVLFLIREELKSRRFFAALENAGISDVAYQTSLGKLIAQMLEIDLTDDDTLERFEDILDQHAQSVNEDNELLSKSALAAYHELSSLVNEQNNAS